MLFCTFEHFHNKKLEKNHIYVDNYETSRNAIEMIKEERESAMG